MRRLESSVVRAAVVGLMLLLFGAGPAWAQHLWPKLAYGMTPDEVLRAVPHSARSSDDAVELDRYVLADTEFTVRFLFRAKHLHQVHLDQPTKLVQNEVTLRAFDKVVDVLRKTYGQEADRHVESESWGLAGE